MRLIFNIDLKKHQKNTLKNISHQKSALQYRSTATQGTTFIYMVALSYKTRSVVVEIK